MSLGLAAIAIVAALGVLAVFHQVLRNAVEQGDLRRQATATQLQATWRCNALREREGRQACIAQSSLVPPDTPTRPAVPAVAVAPLVPAAIAVQR